MGCIVCTRTLFKNQMLFSNEVPLTTSMLSNLHVIILQTTVFLKKVSKATNGTLKFPQEEALKL